MFSFIRLLVIGTLFFNVTTVSAKCEPQGKCCEFMGGISYCDASAGRYLCQNGYYSSCYCTRHAVMDLQNLQGCCLWQGGVMTNDETGLVICNNGAVSEECSLSAPNQSSSAW